MQHTFPKKISTNSVKSTLSRCFLLGVELLARKKEQLTIPSYPHNLKTFYKGLNFQFDVEVRLRSFFLKHGGCHGFDGNKTVLVYLIPLF